MSNSSIISLYGFNKLNKQNLTGVYQSVIYRIESIKKFLSNVNLFLEFYTIDVCIQLLMRIYFIESIILLFFSSN
jgi:hypothetical protein